jgi:hypothetical protein
MDKKTSDVVAVVAVVVGFAGYLAAIGTSPISVAARFGLSNHVLLNISVLVMAGGSMLLIWRTVVAVAERIRRTGGLGRFPRVLRATRADLPELHALYVRQFGEGAPSLAWMQRVHSRNGNIFQIVVEWNPVTGQRKIVGSFKVMPLKRNVILLLEWKGQGITGANLPHDLIVRPRGIPSAWYVGDVVSCSRSSARLVLKGIVDHFAENLRPGMRVYARGLTPVGLKYLREFQFQPVGQGKMEIGTMCALYPPELDDLVARLHSNQPLRPRNATMAVKAKSVVPLAVINDSSGLEVLVPQIA